MGGWTGWVFIACSEVQGRIFSRKSLSQLLPSCDAPIPSPRAFMHGRRELDNHGEASAARHEGNTAILLMSHLLKLLNGSKLTAGEGGKWRQGSRAFVTC